MIRDRREYHRALRAAPGYSEMQAAKKLAKKLDPEFAEKERERERLRSIKRRLENSAKLNEAARLRHAARVQADPAYRRTKADNALKWIKGNPEKACASVMRRDAQKLRAVPKWANEAAIRAVYRLAAERRAAGIDCQVDHIVPLRSPHVCGLHVADNLQLLDPRLNLVKGNRYWPDR